jgi:hypothetical protein
LVVVHEVVFIICDLLHLDRLQKHHAAAIDHGFNQPRHLTFNSKINQEASGGASRSHKTLAKT